MGCDNDDIEALEETDDQRTFSGDNQEDDC